MFEVCTYRWELSRVPSHYVCGASFSTDQAMIFRQGGLTFIHHNELRDLTASWVSWLHEVCHDMAIESSLQPLNGNIVVPASANH